MVRDAKHHITVTSRNYNHHHTFTTKRYSCGGNKVITVSKKLLLNLKKGEQHVTFPKNDLLDRLCKPLSSKDIEQLTDSNPIFLNYIYIQAFSQNKCDGVLSEEIMLGVQKYCMHYNIDCEQSLVLDIRHKLSEPELVISSLIQMNDYYNTSTVNQNICDLLHM